MKMNWNLFSWVAGLLCVFGALCPVKANAQDIPPITLNYQWATPTGTGQLGHYIILTSNTLGASTNNYSISWSISGGAPSVCTFRVEGSFDNVNWYGLDTTSPASTSCTTSNMESIVYKPVQFLRINILTWTVGTGTLNFQFTGTKN